MNEQSTDCTGGEDALSVKVRNEVRGIVFRIEERVARREVERDAARVPAVVFERVVEHSDVVVIDRAQ